MGGWGSVQTNKQCHDALLFWFGDDPLQPLKNKTLWFQKDAAFDALVRGKFEALLGDAIEGRLASWRETPKSCLAYIILLDQFTRNIYRDTPQAFAQDACALAATKEALDKGFDQRLTTVERSMLYMPFMHSEDLVDQERGIQLFEKLAADAEEALKAGMQMNLDYMIQHADIIKRFGRFPHRNVILGRQSTEEELIFLKMPNASF
jgi:uncharacterized protein (DUF924 family)